MKKRSRDATALALLAATLLSACRSSDATGPGLPLEWTTVASGSSDRLYSVWGSSRTDVWAVGHNGTILHYDGRSWSRVPSGTTSTLRSVWGAAPNDIWVVGHADWAVGPMTPTILHYDGRGWQHVAAPADVASFAYLEDVWGSSSSKVWAVGGYEGTILHFDGTEWSLALNDNAFETWAIGGSSATNVWVVGHGTTLRFDGARWVSNAGGAGMAPSLFGVWGGSDSDVWAVGTSAVLHFDGTRWERVTSTVSDTPITYSGIWGSSANDIWLSARTGSSGPGIGAIFHRNSAGWSRISLGTTDPPNLFDIWGSSATDVWAVGDDGTILHGARRR